MFQCSSWMLWKPSKKQSQLYGVKWPYMCSLGWRWAVDPCQGRRRSGYFLVKLVRPYYVHLPTTRGVAQSYLLLRQ